MWLGGVVAHTLCFSVEGRGVVSFTPCAIRHRVFRFDLFIHGGLARTAAPFIYSLISSECLIRSLIAEHFLCIGVAIAELSARCKLVVWLMKLCTVLCVGALGTEIRIGMRNRNLDFLG